jgi:predicted transcriptional regulator
MYLSLICENKCPFVSEYLCSAPTFLESTERQVIQRLFQKGFITHN